ncbi:methane monooxygenase [Oleomonas cavernae]|uniref:Methane monooxygenase n=1 Tax=Oleomonas cavernae TaxID=2320859 RepID=A0A418WIK2_9PROT|nr:MmoB/DmpM family protein [Oleomonas cavernae]RJF89810.1 methane monooxygenase [Oleomonas cavernae]
MTKETLTEIQIARALQDKMLSRSAVTETRSVVLALMKADEIEIAVEWLREAYADDPTLKIEDHGVYYRIDCAEEFTFDLDEIQDMVGRPYSVYDFLVNVSTTVGRAYVNGNTFTITTALIGWESEVPR